MMEIPKSPASEGGGSGSTLSLGERIRRGHMPMQPDLLCKDNREKWDRFLAAYQAGDWERAGLCEKRRCPQTAKTVRCHAGTLMSSMGESSSEGFEKLSPRKSIPD